MKAIAIFLLFIGMILIIQGYYESISICPKNKTIIKYVPRFDYEQQLSPSQSLDSYFKSIFDKR